MRKQRAIWRGNYDERCASISALVRERAKTGELVGDGTSTATILVHAIFADGLRNIAWSAAWTGPDRLRSKP